MKKHSFLKFGLTAGFALVASFSMKTIAQEAFGGEPLSKKVLNANGFRMASTEISTELIRPDFNPEDLKAKNQWNQHFSGKPLQIGQVIKTDISFVQKATPILVDGKTLYRMAIKTSGAKGIALYYKDFFIPKGGKLYIYTPDYKVIKGAYTFDSHPTHGSFATEPMVGNELVLEYEAPQSGEMPSIEIDGLGYLFRSIGLLQTKDNIMTASQEDTAESCQINANCEEGTKFYDQQHGVVAMIMVFKNGAMSFCSGDLMNNTSEDYTPYILSAAHCADSNGKIDPSSDFARWIFAFHYKKKNCSSASLAAANAKTVIGCEVKSFLTIRGQSDGLLLKLLNPVPDNYRVFYNGWDRSEDTPKNVLGLHHPNGDAMKVSYGIDPTTGISTRQRWSESGTGGSRGDLGAHFSFSFEHGSTQGGSSGSSLFNMDKRVVGTLTGGGQYLDGQGYFEPCRGSDYYGRLYYHWDHYASKGTLYQMKSFLDPGNKGNKTLDGTWKGEYKALPLIKDLKATYDEANKNVSLTWSLSSPMTQKGFKVKYAVFRNSERIATIEDNNYAEVVPEKAYAQGVVNYSVQPLFINEALKDESQAELTDIASVTVTLKGLINKIKPHVVKQTSGGVKVSWEAANNYQLLTRYSVSEKPKFANLKTPAFASFSFTLNGQTYTYAQTNSALKALLFSEIWHLPGIEDFYYISQVNVMPQKAGESFDLYLGVSSDWQRNPDRPLNSYIETVNVPKNWKEGEWLKVPLRKPYKISPKELLLVGVLFKSPGAIVKEPHTIKVISNSKDDIYDYCIGKTAALMPEVVGRRNYTELKEFRYQAWMESLTGITREAAGYLAISPVITRSRVAPDPLKEPLDDIRLKASSLASLPMVTSYELYKNGNLVKTFKIDDWLQYKDAAGTEKDNYEVKVLYDRATPANGETVTKAEQLQQANLLVYPSVVKQEFFLKNPSSVESMDLYSFDGKKIKSWTAMQEQVGYDMSQVEKGIYMLVIHTLSGDKTQRIYKE